MKVIYNFTYVVLYTGFECLSQLTAFTFTAQNTKCSPFFRLSQCCDLGYHASLNRALRTYLSAEYNVETSKHGGLETIENAAENLEANADKQRLMETYNNVFCPPIRFDFQSHMGDMVSRCDYYCLWHDIGEIK